APPTRCGCRPPRARCSRSPPSTATRSAAASPARCGGACTRNCSASSASWPAPPGRRMAQPPAPLEFPTDYPLKVLGRPDNEFRARVHAIVLRHAPVIAAERQRQLPLDLLPAAGGEPRAGGGAGGRPAGLRRRADAALGSALYNLFVTGARRADTDAPPAAPVALPQCPSPSTR